MSEIESRIPDKAALATHGVKSLKVALRVLNARGFETRNCLRNTGISDHDLVVPNVRVGLRQELAFYRNVRVLTNDPLIGLEIGGEYHLPNYGILGYAIMSARNLGVALRLILRFLPLTYTCHDASLHDDPDTPFIQLMPLRAYEDCEQIITDRDMSALYMIAGEVLGRRLPLVRIDLAHHGQAFRERYEAHFGAPVTFSQPVSRLYIARNVLGEALAHSDASTARLSEHQCEMLLATLNQRDHIIDAVRQILLEQPGTFASLEVVAGRLGMSSRNLRRALTDTGKSFTDILSELRFQLARQYLEITNLTIEQVGHTLGYTETANFSHAFKRWSGVSPHAYRTRHSLRARTDM